MRVLARSIVMTVTLFAIACGDGGGKSYRFAAPAVPAGVLDPSFGNGGVVQSAFRGYSGAQDLIVLADGRILVGGTVSDDDGQRGGLVRYLPDGTLDRTFGIDGLATDPVTEGPGRQGVAFHDMERAPDGSIVAIGCIGIIPPCDWSIARYSADGVLDASFGEGGVVAIARRGPPPSALGVAADGSVILVARALSDDFGDYLVTKLTPSGALDPSFGGGGEVRVDVGEDVAESVLLQPDGKIVVGGCTGEAFTLLRLRSDGSLDAGFGRGGVSVTTHPGLRGTVVTLLPGPDAGYLAVGTIGDEAAGAGAIARFTASGELDARFGDGGAAILSPLAQRIRFAGAAVDARGAIVTGGNVLVDQVFVFALVRVDADGMLDSTFGTDGVVLSRVGESSEVHAVAIAPDGGILAAGLSVDRGSILFALARYGSGGR